MRPPPLLPFFLYASITTWHRYSPISSQHWYACCMWCQSAVCSLGTSFYPLFLNILICHWFSWKLMLFLFFFQVWVIMYSKNEVFITFHYHFMVVIHFLFFLHPIPSSKLPSLCQWVLYLLLLHFILFHWCLILFLFSKYYFQKTNPCSLEVWWVRPIAMHQMHKKWPYPPNSLSFGRWGFKLWPLKVTMGHRIIMDHQSNQSKKFLNHIHNQQGQCIEKYVW